MDYRRLGASGFTVPVLSFGTGTFGGKGEFFSQWGSTDVDEARRLVDICMVPASQCSIVPTSTPPVRQKKFSARQSRDIRAMG